jgi:hypothetical protein
MPAKTTPGDELRDALLADMKEAGLEPDSRETAILAELVDVENTLAALAEVVEADGYTIQDPKKGTVVHPAVVESRQARGTKSRLLNSLDLGTGKKTAASQHGRKAAEKRWGPKRGHVEKFERPSPPKNRKLPEAV